MLELTYIVREKMESNRGGPTRFMISASNDEQASGVRASDLTINDLSPEQASGISVGGTLTITVTPSV